MFFFKFGWILDIPRSYRAIEHVNYFSVSSLCCRLLAENEITHEKYHPSLPRWLRYKHLVQIFDWTCLVLLTVPDGVREVRVPRSPEVWRHWEIRSRLPTLVGPLLHRTWQENRWVGSEPKRVQWVCSTSCQQDSSVARWFPPSLARKHQTLSQH